MATYPGGIPDIPATGWTHDQVAQEIEAIATELGVSPSGAAADVAARLVQEEHFKPVMAKPGAWIQPAFMGTAVGNMYQPVRLTSNQNNSAPIFMLRSEAVIDQVGIQVATAAAGGEARIFVYDSDEDGYPRNLLISSPTLDCSTTGNKWGLLDPTVTLPPGMYHAAVRTNDSAVVVKAIGNQYGFTRPAATVINSNDVFNVETHLWWNPGTITTPLSTITTVTTANQGANCTPLVLMRRASA